VLVAGEPGIGKTRLMRGIATQARTAGFRVSGGSLTAQYSLDPLFVVSDLERDIHASKGDLGAALLSTGRVRRGDSLGARRQVVLEVVDALIKTMEGPTVWAFNDLQWADELSLEVITELAQRSRELPLLLIGCYRLDELPFGSIHREWRSRLVTQRLAEEVRLRRLTREETGLVTTLLLGSGLPAPREVVDAVYTRTNGIPLFIEELLAAVGDGSASDGRAILRVAVPDTIEDAVLAHANRLSDDARTLAQAGSVMGRCFTPDVIAGVLDLPVAELDDALDELVNTGILYPFNYVDEGYYDFRHMLLRDAIYSRVPRRDLRRYHARAAEFGAKLIGATEVHTSVHFERAGMREQAFAAARSAADESMKVHSHREAVDLYRRAISNMPAELPDAEKARIYLAASDAAGGLDRNELAEDLARSAYELALRAGNPFLANEAFVNLVNVARRMGRPIPDRRDAVRRLVLEAERLPDTAEGDWQKHLALWQAAMVELDAGRYPEARGLLEEARDLVRKHEFADDARDMTGYLLLVDGLDGAVGPSLESLAALAADAKAGRFQTAAVNAFRDMAMLAVRGLEYRRASLHLAEGLEYTDEVQQSYCGHIIGATRAMVDWADGRWDDAVIDAGQALSEPGSQRARIWAQIALGWTALGRGGREVAESHLRPAREAGQSSGLLELELPALWGLAEAALLAGDPSQAVELCEEALATARPAGEGMLLAPFAVTGVRAYQQAGQPERAARFLDEVSRAVRPVEEVVAPAIVHATGVVRLGEGSLTAAREALTDAVRLWDERGRRWEGLWARLDLASANLRSSRYVEATALIREVREASEAMGSEPLLARADELMRVAKGRGDQVEPWHPLTVREFEVAQKIADGLTNAMIGEELFVSPKTVSAHVEHILAKLGVSRRAEIAAWVSTIRTPARAR
jgi:DNA-binding CsgD family transcriptional regulator